MRYERCKHGGIKEKTEKGKEVASGVAISGQLQRDFWKLLEF